MKPWKYIQVWPLLSFANIQLYCIWLSYIAKELLYIHFLLEIQQLVEDKL